MPDSLYFFLDNIWRIVYFMNLIYLKNSDKINQLYFKKGRACNLSEI